MNVTTGNFRYLAVKDIIELYLAIIFKFISGKLPLSSSKYKELIH